MEWQRRGMILIECTKAFVAWWTTGGKSLGFNKGEAKFAFGAGYIAAHEKMNLGSLFPTMKLWQHEETGKITASESQPPEGWFEIPAMYEDELPEDISEAVYSWWFENSFVDGVRIGPKITLGLRRR